MALETTFPTPTGVAVLVDAMAIGRNERGHELGVNSPGVVLRSLSCENGTVEMELEYAPRFEYGLIAPLLRPVQGGTLALIEAHRFHADSGESCHLSNREALHLCSSFGRSIHSVPYYRVKGKGGENSEVDVEQRNALISLQASSGVCSCHPSA
jgi:hypothetical protein